ncbi:lipoxygenase homology domain-containing protein 1-like isoform X2 [Pecten maximus]|uniref:lipoxygenase homology domain-containing protein 1-like isoform X2 n=1 Tax=Pecten maximus TaxID=6579 RepID=UPI001458B20C|nr:lipoxygenase homology domain-containing protein 1-like isoform X2 [Pecten maximus]
MQAPCTNSEAVKRCMSFPNKPLSSQMRYIEPRPPYAAGNNVVKRERPYSAPMRRITTNNHTEPWRGPKYDRTPARPSYNVTLNHHTWDTEFSRRAPYAPRRKDVYSNSMYDPVDRGGKTPPFPPYDPLNDPHLTEYFDRRFGLIQAASATKRGWGSRPSSASSYMSGGSKRIKKSSGIGSSSGEKSTLYKVAVLTGDLKNASTDAKVFITLKGLKGKIPKTRLTKKAGSVKSNKDVAFRFSRDSTHIFKVRGPNVGNLKSVIIEHNGTKKEDAWFLREIEVVHVKTKKSWVFVCNQWLSLVHGDQQTQRELFPRMSPKTTYEIVAVTGDKMNAATNANVYLTIYGRTGATEKIPLKNNTGKMFERGSSDIFKVNTRCVGPMRKVRVEHDNTGLGAGWYLERIVVSDMKHQQWKYFFPCGQWLARDEGDGAICRDLIGSKDPFGIRKESKYKITVYTGDNRGAGTDANVYVTIFGEVGDSGEKRLDSTSNNYRRGKSDEFMVKAPCLGRLERIRIGHDNSGFGPGWFLDKVIVDDVDNNIVYEFPCNRWLAMDEDDGMTSRDLIVNVGPMNIAPGIPYVITVTTGDKSNAGTDARVFVVMNGPQGKTSGKIWLETGKFERGTTDIFNVDVVEMLSPLKEIEIGHDNSGLGPGWYLEQVIVFCPSTGIEQVFPCQKWFATNSGDGQIQRTLKEQKAVRKTKEKKIPWLVVVSTSDIKSAGTDANVYMVAYGDKGKSDKVTLSNKGDNFEKGQTDHFKVGMVDIGKLYKIRVWHDNEGLASGWHLHKFVLENMTTKEKYNFKCGRWLADDEDDKSLIREMPAESKEINKPLPLVKYNVEVHTGKKMRAGTDANVFLNMFGELGDTGDRPLKESKSNRNKFEKGNVDMFTLEAVTLLKMNKVIIGHDGKGAGSGWFLDKVVVKQEGSDKYDYTFECERWLATSEDDGQIVRELTLGSHMLSTTTYNVFVTTGDVRSAGTDANVSIKIFGSKGDTGELQLRSSENTSNKFERGKTDMFKLESVNIGVLKKIRIGHDNSKPGAGWYLDEVRIDIPSRGEHYLFACHRWLAKDEKDGLTMVELEPSHKEDREKRRRGPGLPYEVTVWTSDKSSAGTDANVFLQMYGDSGKTEKEVLNNRSDNFERNKKDTFKIEAADVGRLQKIRVGHDGTGMFSGWHLEKVLIQRHPRKGTRKTPKRRRTPSANERRKSLVSDLQERDEDSDGSNSSSSPTPRRRRSFKKHKEPELKTVEEESEEDVYDGTETEDYWFFVNEWFSRGEGDGAIQREFTPTDKDGKPLKGALQDVEYEIHVFTGNVRGAGTDSNVFINIYGENFDSGERQLKDSNNFNKFENGQEDIFKLKIKELGRLVKLRIRHDNKGIGAAWYLDRVEVVDTKKRQTFYFLCQRWLATGEDDGQICRELVPVDKSLLSKSGKDSARAEVALETKAAMTTYYVNVKTGTVWGAGTDANVYIVLFGDKDHTDTIFLKSSMTNKNKFEGGQTDKFLVEAVNIGELKKIKIGHDDAGGGAPWFLDDVVIDSPSLGKCWVFPCHKWLSSKDGDCQLERELWPQELNTQEYTPCIPYELKVYTSDKSGAGTSAEVYIQLYGKELCTTQKQMCPTKRERSDKFKRGATDLFLLEMEDVGDTIEKIRIGHNNAGLTAGWHLNRVEIRKLHETGRGSVTYVFPCDRWLARDEDDTAIERELIAGKVHQEMIGRDGQVKKKDIKLRDQLQNKQYVINVHTGDVSGAGTDANVFLTIWGDRGDSGERKLHKSETYSDKFERNHIDVFRMDIVDLGNIYKIKIRHDNSMFNPAWYLDYVEVTDTTNNQKFMFHCERWLAKNKDDKKIQRSVYVKGYDGDMESSTGTLGTMKSTRYGSVASLDSLKSSDPFSKSPRLSRKQQLAQEEMPDGDTIPYTVKVSTGKGKDDGTNSNVWVRVIGPRGKDTGRLFLELAQKDKFMPGSVETFSLEAIDVGDVKKLEIGHDGEAPGTGWFVREVSVDVPTKGKHYLFQCKQWLARDKFDGKTIRIFTLDDGVSTVTSYRPMVQYECEVTTGDITEAGTDTQITLTVFGAKGTSAPVLLEKIGDRFERGHSDLIKMEIEDVAPIKKIRIQTNGKGSRPDWYLEKLTLRSYETDALSVFEVNDWFGKKKGTLMRDIAAKERGKFVIKETSYRISVKTSDVSGAGTDAKVFITLFGANGDTGEIHLAKSETYKDPFENNQIDVFTIQKILSVGELSKCRVWHDNSGFGAAWHLAYIEVEDLSNKKVYTFHCDNWLSKKDGDKQILRELTCGTIAKPATGAKETTTYELEVKTSDKKEAGTIHHGWVILEGSKESVKYKLENSARNKILRRGNTDYFQVPSRPLGKLKRVVVGATEREDHPLQDMEGHEAMWFCYEISATDTTTGNKYLFPCKKWIQISDRLYSKKYREVLEVKSVEESQVSVVRNLAPIKYEIIVFTGDVFGAGTNANVSITIFGSNGDSGKRALQQSFRDLFERNQVDKFQMEILDLGELHKVRIEHDNSGFRPAWFLDRIEIVNLGTNNNSVFPCNNWLDKNKGDKSICRDLLARE